MNLPNLIKLLLKMIKKLFQRSKDRKMLLSDGVKTSVNYSVIVNNDEVKYFDDYKSALSYIESYRNANQIFNLSVFRVEFYSLVSNLKNNL